MKYITLTDRSKKNKQNKRLIQTWQHHISLKTTTDDPLELQLLRSADQSINHN